MEGKINPISVTLIRTGHQNITCSQDKKILYKLEVKSAKIEEPGRKNSSTCLYQFSASMAISCSWIFMTDHGHLSPWSQCSTETTITIPIPTPIPNEVSYKDTNTRMMIHTDTNSPQTSKPLMMPAMFPHNITGIGIGTILILDLIPISITGQDSYQY